MTIEQRWIFKACLRSRAYGRMESRLAYQRLQEAVAKIKKVAKMDPVTAGDGVVTLMERVWPADGEGLAGASGH
jgi:hypothetical protein